MFGVLHVASLYFKGVLNLNITKDNLLEKLDEIRKIIVDSENPDGSLKIDMKMSMVALEFAKTTIEKMISK